MPRVGFEPTMPASKRPKTLHAFFFFFLVCEAIGTAATPGLLCQPRVIVKMIVEKQMVCRLAGEIKVLGENCPSATFVHHIIPHDQTRLHILGMTFLLFVIFACLCKVT
jgi:hypothetical protein